jgi:tetratricopeptide (TPR) repeat protein
MEVAVIKSITYWCGRALGPAAVLAVVLSAGGCAEVMTNTRADRDNAIKLYNDGRYADAAGAFRETIKHNPADLQSHYYLALSLDRVGAFEQAIEQYRTTLKLMENSLEGKENRTMRMQVLDLLASDVARVQDHDPSTAMLNNGNTAEDQYLRAKIESRLGDPDAAIEAYQRAALLDPKFAEVHRDLGLLLAQLGQTDRARQELKQAYAMNPADQQTAAGLRKVGVVPGPSLKDESDMAHPLVPVGPLPELQFPGPQQNGTGDNQRASVSPKD